MRVAIFIDGGYFLSKTKSHRIDPDYRKLAEYLLAPLTNKFSLDLLRCYFYYCSPWMSSDPTDAETKRMDAYEQFVQEIHSIDRWALRLGKLHKRSDGDRDYFEQKRVDVLLSCDLVRHAAAGHIQHAILVAGDSDFIPAVEVAKESGVTVTLWCGESNTVHEDLVKLCDEVHRFDWRTLPQLKESDGSRHTMDSMPSTEPRNEPRRSQSSSGNNRNNDQQHRSSGGSQGGDKGKQQRQPQSQGQTASNQGANSDGKRRSRRRRRPANKGAGRDQQATTAIKEESLTKSIAAKLKRLTKKLTS